MTKTMKSFGSDFIVYLVEGTRDMHCEQTMITPSTESDPLTFKKAMMSQDVTLWNEAINDEMKSIM